MLILQKNFLMRRRVDLWILLVAAIAMPIRQPAGPIILFAFSCIGVYLAFSKDRWSRFYGVRFYLLISAYMVWCLGLMAWRGELSLTNRQLGYVLLLWLYSFAGLGMALIREPVRIFTLGSRVGLLICTALVAGEELLWGGRIGIGGNAAVFSYAAAVTAVAATLSVKNTPRLLPNGPWYLIIGTGIVFASETRAVMITLALLAIFESIVLISRIASRRVKLVSSLAFAACLTAILTFGPVASVLSQRFSGMIYYYETGDSSHWKDKNSADTRKEMWRGAVKVIVAHPLIGVGSDQKMWSVRNALGDKTIMLKRYIHVHNAVLDELLINGAIGFLLLSVAIVYGLAFIWKHNFDCGFRRVLIYFIITWGSYAMLHNPLLHESSIAVTMFFFSAVYAGTYRNILRRNSGALSALRLYGH